MHYRINRGEQEFGPYSLPELKQYLAEGRIVLTDLAKSEGMEDWAPVAEVAGDIAAVSLSGPAGVHGGAVAGSQPTAASGFVLPPDLHWALVLLIAVVSCCIFLMVWQFVQAIWARKIDKESRAIWYYAISVGSSFLIGGVIGFTGATQSIANEVVIALQVFSYILSFTLNIAAAFSIRRSALDYYQESPFPFRLGPVMTFFFSTFYFQYHFSRINEWHRTGVVPA
jgi:hypothetical protein